jgi:hypothetical protein
VVQATSRSEANTVIDKIRAAAGLIESVVAASSSLEDLFIEATKAEKAA